MSALGVKTFVAPVIGALLLGGALAFVRRDVSAASKRLANPETAQESTNAASAAGAASASAATADDAEAPYCTPQFKGVLQRVLHACGLVGGQERRGCQPADVKSFASISDDDFNALFTPLAKRGGILMFDDNGDKLDDGAKKLLDEKWEERRGARYFFVVSRASKTGGAELNRALSHRRANSVLFHLQEQSGHGEDADLDKKVGMLWLGSEFAQLSKDYCEGWTTSRPGKKCDSEAINRSSFISWVDCRL
jgi:outer membrane protein OmpA-like peptidoglycan-associated protein